MPNYNEMLIKTLANFAGFVTRLEGRKFLRLSENFDEQAVKVDKASSNDLISLYIHIYLPKIRHGDTLPA